MEIKFIRVYLSGSKRIHELYEEGQKKEAKIRELRTAVKAQDLQMKGWGRDFQELLLQIEEHKAEEARLKKQLELSTEMYKKSEEARKSLGEKLEKAMGALELLKGGAQA